MLEVKEGVYNDEPLITYLIKNKVLIKYLK
jgi:hypothetical protein